MASVKSYSSDHDISMIFRHNQRTNKTYKNPDVDLSKSDENYCPVQPIDGWSYQRYKERLSQVYVYNRADVVRASEWVITLPQDCPTDRERDFFKAVANFCAKRYGGRDNVIGDWVHKDEAGQPHLHHLFMPIVADTNPKHEQTEKLCKHAVLTKTDLKTFHPDLQKYLEEHDIPGTVNTGITRRQGGNRTIYELKQFGGERSYKRSYTHEYEYER